MQQEAAAAASCCTVPKATAETVQVDKTLFTFYLVYSQNRTEYARTHRVTLAHYILD